MNYTCKEIGFVPHHIWGDDWPHWDKLYKAEIFIRDYVYKHSLCRLSSKEKYGTLRYEFVTPPRWCWYIFNCWIYYKWIAFGNKVLTRACYEAIHKYPEVKDEILDDLDWR